MLRADQPIIFTLLFFLVLGSVKYVDAIGSSTPASAPSISPGDEDFSAVSKTVYNKQASNWVRTTPSCLSDFTGRPVVFDMFSSILEDAGDGSKVVLDVGCGEGYCARKVVELGASRVIGSDVSEEMIKCANMVSEGDDRFAFYSAPCCDLLKGLEEHREELGIQEAKDVADVAIAVFLFNYLNTFDMATTMKQIYDALKPGGMFIFSVPHPSMIFCHDKNAIFHLDSEAKGYFSSINQKIMGQISRIDGVKLNIMSIHKTLNDYVTASITAGFHIEEIREVGVTDDHLEMNPAFFESVKDRPLHLIFRLRK